MKASVPTWIRIVLRSAGFGAGFSLMLAIVAGGWSWYSSRPKPPRSWDTKAIEAHYVTTHFFEDEKENKLRAGMVFDLRNSTGADYTLEANPSENTFVMQRVKSNDALVNGMGLTWSSEHGSGTKQLDAPGLPKGAFIDAPILIPVGQTVRMDFWSEYDIFDVVAALGKGEKLLLSDKTQQREILRMP